MSQFLTRIFQFLFFVLFAAILGTGFAICYPKYRQMVGLNADKANKYLLIEAKKAEIADLRDRQRRFNTDREFVENLARANRYLYPGELVFEFGD